MRNDRQHQEGDRTFRPGCAHHSGSTSFRVVRAIALRGGGKTGFVSVRRCLLSCLREPPGQSCDCRCVLACPLLRWLSAKCAIRHGTGLIRTGLRSRSVLFRREWRESASLPIARIFGVGSSARTLFARADMVPGARAPKAALSGTPAWRQEPRVFASPVELSGGGSARAVWGVVRCPDLVANQLLDLVGLDARGQPLLVRLERDGQGDRDRGVAQ